MRAVGLTLALGLGLSVAAHAQFYGNYRDVSPPGSRRVAVSDAGVNVRVDQRLNEFVPTDTEFKDEYGRSVKLQRYFSDKPVVILPIFYKCPGICETELFGLIDSLKGFKKDFAGREFTVVILGIDPNEGADLAADKKDTAIAAYMGASSDKARRAFAETGWHFLTGDLKNIRRVTDALGFKFTFDETNGTIVHPSGLMVLTPSGKISRYFLSTDYPQQLLLDAIRKAGKEEIGARDDRPFFLACIEVDPLTGQKTLNILNVLKTMGVVTVLALGGAIFLWNRNYRAAQGGNV
ncbi:MAG: SCO family protein [Armatimonadetes bacterium]|nr:SCO family protein [Armatimonadota bacterium]